MSWLLGKLAGAAGPYIVGGVGAVVLGLLGWIGWLHWDIHTLRTAVAEAERDAAGFRVELSECRADNAELQDSIEEQNRRVRALQDERDQAAAMASLRGVRMLTAERERELPEGHGPAVMNDWLREALKP